MTARYDRREIMRDGRRLGLGWSWSQCLSTAWQAAKLRREAARLKMAA